MPEGWAWCRLRSLASTISSKDYQISEREIKTSGTYPVISQSANYIEGYCDESNYLLSVEKSIIIFGDHTRNVKYIDFDFVVGADGVKILKPTILINDKFLYYSILYASSRIVNRGYSRHFQFLSSFFFPIPSLTEQKLIVEQIENDYKVIDKIENNKAELQTCVLKAKSKILDLAIHGKLVPQDANDEPASVLLEKLRAEKEDKIAKGELKRDKNDSYIYKGSDNCYYQRFANGCEEDLSDEIPYELPESWTWCTLGEIYNHTTGKALKKTNNKGTLRKYITTSNLYWNSFDFSEVRSMYFTDDELEKCTIKKGDLVLCNGGDVGRAAIWNYDYDICYQNHVSRLRPKAKNINNRFFMYVIMIYKKKGMLNGKGVGITSLSANDLLSAVIPLPPYSEQKRIVSKIEEIFSYLDTISSNLE